MCLDTAHMNIIYQIKKKLFFRHLYKYFYKYKIDGTHQDMKNYLQIN